MGEKREHVKAEHMEALTDNIAFCDPTQCLCGCHGSHGGGEDVGLLPHNRRWVCHQRRPRLSNSMHRKGGKDS